MDRPHINRAGHPWRQFRRHDHAGYRVEAFLLEIADTRRVAKAKRATHGEKMIRESAGVGVVLVNDETAFVVEQPVQDVRRFMGGRRDDARVIRPELIRHVGIELHAGILTVVQIGVTVDLTAPAGAEELRIR